MPLLRVRGRWLAPTATLLIAVAATAVGRSLPDPGQAPPAVFLGLVAAGVLTLLTVSVPLPIANRIAAASVLLLPLVTRPLDDPTPWAVVFTLLALATLGAAFAPPVERLRGAALRSVAWATAAQWVLHADRVWSGAFDLPAVASLVGAPAVAGLAIASMGRDGARAGRVAGLLAFVTGPGWTALSVAVLVAAALSAAGWARRGDPRAVAPLVGAAGALPGLLSGAPWLAAALAGFGAAALSPADAAAGATTRRVLESISRAALGLVASAALLTLGGGAPPWSLARPVADVAAAAMRGVADRPLVLHEGRSLRLADHPLRFDAPGDTRIRSLAVDSFLLDGAAVDCGRPVAELALVDGERTLWSAPLVVGRATGDWAAERADVRARAECAAPTPFQRWPAPGGRFFSRRYRARWAVDPALAATGLEVRPIAPDPGARLVLTRVALGR